MLPSAVSYTAAVRACEKGKQWEAALALMGRRWHRRETAPWMHVSEFMATQKHPLIRSVLTRVYGIEEDGSNVVDDDRPPTPLHEMRMGDETEEAVGTHIRYYMQGCGERAYLACRHTGSG